MNATNPSSPIVAGVDGKGDGIKAAEFAAILATTQRRSLMLVHAYRRSPAIDPLLPLAEPRSALYATRALGYIAFTPTDNAELMRDAGELTLNGAEQHVLRIHPELHVIKRLVKGSAPRALISASDAATAVVVARNRERALERFFTGSTTSAVAAHAKCPVVVVPTDWVQLPRQERVVVGVDGSSSEYEALAFAFQQASWANSELLVVHSWQPRIVGTGRSPKSPALWAQEADDDRRAVAETLAGWAEIFPDVAVTTVFSEVPPADALVSASDNADMVVVGARGRGGFRGLPLGSTARAVISHASCLAVVVRRARDVGPRVNEATYVGTEFVAPFY